MPQRLERFQRNRLGFGERLHRGPAEGRHMADGAQSDRQIARQAADIRAFSAFHLEDGVIVIRAVDEREPVDDHGPRRRVFPRAVRP